MEDFISGNAALSLRVRGLSLESQKEALSVAAEEDRKVLRTCTATAFSGLDTSIFASETDVFVVFSELG
jgi:hypothetical protein